MSLSPDDAQWLAELLDITLPVTLVGSATIRIDPDDHSINVIGSSSGDPWGSPVATFSGQASSPGSNVPALFTIELGGYPANTRFWVKVEATGQLHASTAEMLELRYYLISNTGGIWRICTGTTDEPKWRVKESGINSGTAIQANIDYFTTPTTFGVNQMGSTGDVIDWIIRVYFKAP